MQQGARDLDAPHLPAGENTRFVFRTFAEADASQRRVRAPSRFGGADAVQGRVIDHVLQDSEVEIESARLKDDADPAQGLARRLGEVAAEDRDAPVARREEPGDEREERALAGPVETEQHHELAGRNRQADIVERLARAIAVAEACDFERERRRLYAAGHFGATATPQGSAPTWTDFSTFRAVTSMIETSLVRPLTASRYLSPGVRASCQTRWPTSR